MELFTDGNENNYKPFDLFIVEWNTWGENRKVNNNTGGGCLMSFLLITAIPVNFVVATVSALM